jgi:hypothetical protein
MGRPELLALRILDAAVIVHHPRRASAWESRFLGINPVGALG